MLEPELRELIGHPAVGIFYQRNCSHSSPIDVAQVTNHCIISEVRIICWFRDYFRYYSNT